ncbi:MAG: copper chaperone PCu(A)C [Gammaproteobacteria bacterium]
MNAIRPARELARLVLCWCLAGMAHADTTLQVADPWIREAPPAASVHAGYMTLVNTGTEAILIDSVSSPDFEGAEIHRSWVEEGVARMQPVRQLEVPATATLALEPGSYHLMLFDARRALQEGDSATLLLHLADGTCIRVTAPVRRSTGSEHHHHH